MAIEPKIDTTRTLIFTLRGNSPAWILKPTPFKQIQAGIDLRRRITNLLNGGAE